MTTFTPPTTSGRRIADPAKTSRSAAHALWYHYGSWETGLTVWQDSLGAWHESLVPYVGGAVHRVFKDGDLISETGPDEGLATAQAVYLGGHVHDITAAEETALVAAGYGSRINLAAVDIPHWETADLGHLTKAVMSLDGANQSDSPTVDTNERLVVTKTSGAGCGAPNLREFLLHDSVEGSDFVASTVLDPLAYGDDAGGPACDITPQTGIVLRVQESGGKRTGITVNNNIFFIVQTLNIGVWRANLDGSGFENRQFGFPLASILPFPFAVDVELTGNTIRVRSYRPWEAPPPWTDTVYAATVNLDTDAGDAGAIPTPVGSGQGGLIVAHLNSHVDCAARFGPTSFRRTA